MFGLYYAGVYVGAWPEMGPGPISRGFFCRGLIYQAHLLKYINNLNDFDSFYV
jgi:hypothetical protein